MNSFRSLVLCALLVAIFCVLTSAQRPVQSTPETEQQWQQFVGDFGRYYNEKESNYRYSVFLENLGKMEHARTLNPNAQFGPNQFSDLTTEEFVRQYASPVSYEQAWEQLQQSKVPFAPENRSSDRIVADSSSFDWRDQGNYVTPVKDQEQCGSCWDFASTELLESAVAIARQNLMVLSTQQTLDCANAGSCGGGDITGALSWMMSNQVVEDSVYPYTAQDGYCESPYDAGQTGQLSIYYQCRPQQTPDHLQYCIQAYSPAAFGIFGDMSIIQNYQSGIIESCGQGYEGHAMVITGWSQMNGMLVWNVRNSWNTWFGDNGYLYFDANVNPCGINNYAFVATGTAS